MFEALIKIVPLIKKYFYSLVGLFMGYLLLVLLIINLDSSIKVIVCSNWIRISFYLVIFIIWTLFWLHKILWLPGTDENKIGIILALTTENEKQKNRIKIDFAQRLEQTIKNNNLGVIFQILVLEDYYAEKVCNILKNYINKKNELRKKSQDAIKFKNNPIEIKKWKRLQNKTKGHLFIWGSIIERFDQEKTYLLNIDLIVVHKPIQKEISDRFSREILSIFPKEISFYERFELKGFQFTAETIYLTTRYITGTAALISGDPVTALKLHEGLKQQIQNFSKPIPPNYENILKNIDELILAEKFLIARHKYFIKYDLNGVKEILRECINKSNNPYDALLLNAYITFKEDNDPIKSLKLLNRASRYSNHNFTWLYNKSFLLMYLGKYEKGFSLL